MLDVPAMNDILFIVLKRLFRKSYHDKASYLATSALLKTYVLTYYFTEQCEVFLRLGFSKQKKKKKNCRTLEITK